jgi:hypothetical protein
VQNSKAIIMVIINSPDESATSTARASITIIMGKLSDNSVFQRDRQLLGTDAITTQIELLQLLHDGQAQSHGTPAVLLTNEEPQGGSVATSAQLVGCTGQCKGRLSD